MRRGKLRTAFVKILAGFLLMTGSIFVSSVLTQEIALSEDEVDWLAKLQKNIDRVLEYGGGPQISSLSTALRNAPTEAIQQLTPRDISDLVWIATTHLDSLHLSINRRLLEVPTLSAAQERRLGASIMMEGHMRGSQYPDTGRTRDRWGLFGEFDQASPMDEDFRRAVAEFRNGYELRPETRARYIQSIRNRVVSFLEEGGKGSTSSLITYIDNLNIYDEAIETALVDRLTRSRGLHQIDDIKNFANRFHDRYRNPARTRSAVAYGILKNAAYAESPVVEFALRELSELGRITLDDEQLKELLRILTSMESPYHNSIYQKLRRQGIHPEDPDVLRRYVSRHWLRQYSGQNATRVDIGLGSTFDEFIGLVNNDPRRIAEEYRMMGEDSYRFFANRRQMVGILASNISEELERFVAAEKGTDAALHADARLGTLFEIATLSGFDNERIGDLAAQAFRESVQKSPRGGAINRVATHYARTNIGSPQQFAAIWNTGLPEEEAYHLSFIHLRSGVLSSMIHSNPETAEAFAVSLRGRLSKGEPISLDTMRILLESLNPNHTTDETWKAIEQVLAARPELATKFAEKFAELSRGAKLGSVSFQGLSPFEIASRLEILRTEPPSSQIAILEGLRAELERAQSLRDSKRIRAISMAAEETLVEMLTETEGGRFSDETLGAAVRIATLLELEDERLMQRYREVLDQGFLRDDPVARARTEEWLARECVGTALNGPPNDKVVNIFTRRRKPKN